MRCLTVVAGLILFPSSSVTGQDVSRWLDLIRDPQRPDYRSEVLPALPHEVPIPPPPHGEPPAVVRGLYVNAWVFGSDRFYRLVALADSTEVNSLVIDVKDGTGYMTYRSNVPTAVRIGANRMRRAPDARERLELLRQKGIHPIARIVVGKDPLLAQQKPEWSIRDLNGGVWEDRFGDAWVDVYNDSVWVYAAQIAAEAVLLGFAEVQFDYVRFPDEPRENLARAVFPAKSPGESPRAAISRQIRSLRSRIKRLGVPFTIDVFGLTTSSQGDLGIGQNWDDLVQAADVILPMVYPSHYFRGAYGYSRPNFYPYEIVRRALEEGMSRAAAHPSPARIRPYLQAFTLGRPRYTAEKVRDQIRAVEDLGLTDWVLWNPRGVYPDGALRRLDLGPTGGSRRITADPPN